MAAHRMAAVDAQFYWMSAKIPNDQFLLYAFDGEAVAVERAVAQLLDRAHACPQLRMRVHARSALTYPQWVAAGVEPEQVVRHEPTDDSWHGCLAAVTGLADEQLDIRRMPWRVHVFTPVTGIPGSGARAPLRSSKSRMRSATARAPRRWRPGCSGGRLRWRRSPGRGGVSCPGGPPQRPTRTAGWFATPGPGGWRRVPVRGRCFPPTPGPRVCERCAHWCGSARNCPVPQ
ncbi:hypothetical protein BZL30_2581 [Mycobacterium kansasii]|uniref:Uncharacterized protein n=1 Tax=Mycobacterium kansasii TaxID=1768 RepID=A0A1V3XKH9_MYCKA|nr:hypothetical protein BZL30_2581 [Mycobacterium kansasii]OOK79881.1 hypothetical protein BZL29_2549 [Mycobacterium kansasii]